MEQLAQAGAVGVRLRWPSPDNIGEWPTLAAETIRKFSFISRCAVGARAGRLIEQQLCFNFIIGTAHHFGGGRKRWNFDTSGWEEFVPLPSTD